MNIYIAAPLFNEMEIERNLSVNCILESEGYITYLPQRDGGLFFDLRNKGFTDYEIRKQIFQADYNAILSCDVIICLLDGRVLDEGMCIELGIAYGLKKYCIGYKTDYRTQDQFGNNIMLDGTLHTIFNNMDDLIRHLKSRSIFRKPIVVHA